MKKSIKISAYILLTISFLMLIYFVNKQSYFSKVKYSYDNNQPILDLYSKNQVSQKFFSKVDDLESIEIRFGTYTKKINNRIVNLKIYDENNNLIRESNIKSEEIEDNQFVKFEFDKINNSKSNYYAITLECSECTDQEKLAVYGKSESTEFNKALINQNPTNLTLTLILDGNSYCINIILCLLVIICLLNIFIVCSNFDQLKLLFEKKYKKLSKLYKKDFYFYLLEFILSGLSVISGFILIYNYRYKGIINNLDIILFALFFNILLSIFVFKLHDKLKSEQFFALLAIPLGCCYLVFMMPTQVADEITHYTTAYNFSQGNLKYTNSNVKVPSITTKKVINYQELVQNLKTPMDDSYTRGSTSGYNIIGYLPAVIGISIGQLFNLPYFVGYFLARIFTFIAFLIIGYFTIKIAPVGKMLFSIYQLSPMYLHQSVSLSLDAMLNSYCLFLIAYVSYLLFRKETITKKQYIFLFLIMLGISSLKYVYIPLFLLTLMLFFNNNTSKKNKLWILLAILMASLTSIIIYIMHSMIPSDPSSVYTSYVTSNNISFSGQLKYLLSNPLAAIILLKNTFDGMIVFYWETFIGGQLGWLDLVVNRIFVYIYSILLFLSPFLYKEKYEFNIKEKLLINFVFVTILLLILFGMYLTWSSVGAEIISGVQGRYFIPIVILPLLTLCHPKRYIECKNNGSFMCAIILLFVHFNILIKIIGRFI